MKNLRKFLPTILASIPHGGKLAIVSEAKESIEPAEGCGCAAAGQESDNCCAQHYGYLDNKASYLRRLRRIEGQVRGIARMVEEEKYCIDILTQVSAATKALQSVALAMLDEHLGSCVLAAARQGGDEAEIKLAEANDAIARLVR